MPSVLHDVLGTHMSQQTSRPSTLDSLKHTCAQQPPHQQALHRILAQVIDSRGIRSRDPLPTPRMTRPALMPAASLSLTWDTYA